MMGGIPRKVFWNEYLASFKPGKPRKELKAVKKYVEDNCLEGLAGFRYQEKPLVDAIDALCPSLQGFSLRAWGDFMAAVMNTKEGERKYSYLDYAWYAPEEK